MTEAQVRDRWAGSRWWHPGIPWALAGLGGLAMFGSLIGEWQIVWQDQLDPSLPQEQRRELGIGVLIGWGPAWLVGALLLATCAGLALVGMPPLRGHARSVGLVLAGVLFGFLVGAAVQLTQQSIFVGFELEIDLGRGLYAAFASVLLVGGAIYLSGDRQPRPPPLLTEPVELPEQAPDDLAVGPADPFVHVDDDQTLR